jgi:hypothetical protein
VKVIEIVEASGHYCRGARRAGVWPRAIGDSFAWHDSKNKKERVAHKLMFSDGLLLVLS